MKLTYPTRLDFSSSNNYYFIFYSNRVCHNYDKHSYTLLFISIITLLTIASFMSAPLFLGGSFTHHKLGGRDNPILILVLEFRRKTLASFLIISKLCSLILANLIVTNLLFNLHAQSSFPITLNKPNSYMLLFLHNSCDNLLLIFI